MTTYIEVVCKRMLKAYIVKYIRILQTFSIYTRMLLKELSLYHSCVLFQAPGDYNGTAVNVTFPVGTTLIPVPIPIVDDDLHEGLESFSLSLFTSDPNIGLGPDSAVEINDNDGKLVGTCDMDHNQREYCG